MAELGLAEFPQYRAWLMAHADEWTRMEAVCRIPISRFYRDRDVFEAMASTMLPEAAMNVTRSGIGVIRCWSAGCASGEEPYTVALLWRFLNARDWPGIELSMIATDADEVAIVRAKKACYGRSSLKDLPEAWIAQAFQRSDGLFCLGGALRDGVNFRQQDIRQTMPDGPFEIILCRNLVFTYFDEPLQRMMLAGILDRLSPGGFLVLGKHEELPAGPYSLARLASRLPIYRQVTPNG